VNRWARGFFGIAALALLSKTISLSATPLGSQRPQVGDVFPFKQGANFKGWTLVGLAVGTPHHVVFRKGAAYAIAFSRPAGRNRQNGIEIEKIIKLEIAQASAEETVIEDVVCSPDGATAPDVSFYNARLAIVRGIFIGSDTAITKKWRQKIEDCNSGDD